MTDLRPPQPQYYTITRNDLEEFYDSLVHVCGKEYADNMWDCIEARNSHSTPAAAPVRCCETCENVPCKVRDKVPCVHANPCEENGCTDIENCDEICDHSRIYSPVQMEAAKQEAAAQERAKVLDAALQAVDQVAVIYGINNQLREHLSKSIESLRQQGGEPGK
jgi:hypothetical protein